MVEPDPRQFDLRTKIADPHAFIQWKGTDICMDFHCDCGAHNHFDGMFAYFVKCANCGQEWEMPSNVFPRKRCSQSPRTGTAMLMDAD